ncbi:bidirectional sugar transporter SWEET17-like [Corylus avellana]|uniref:bidirectional sugar transporter SWEET17-like n=1 Tax=Corylus avellana TaxID=13451 RepID=UPI00286A9138|nr:bidirectional sugar transporter SWEET17-like [Corylus avellana]
MAELSFVVGVIGIIISVLLFIISLLKTFRRIVERRSTQGFDSLPFILTLLNTALWTYYGLEKTDSLLVVTVNGIGAVVEAVYVGLFLVFPPRRVSEKTAAFAAVLDVWFLGGAILITHFMLQGDTRIDVIGFLCVGLNIFMYSSTLAAIERCVEHRRAHAFPSLLFMFLNRGIWTYYAVLVEDKFLGVSNVIGCLLGVTQLMLYAIYMTDNPS